MERNERNYIHALILCGLCVVVHAGRQYHYVPDPKTWSEAQAYCREKYIDLATISDSEELKDVLDLGQRFNVSAWIGLHHGPQHWNWTAGNSDYRDWGPTTISITPDMAPQEYDAIIDTRWYKHDRTHQHHFICFDGMRNSSHGFISIEQNKNWTSAQNYCREKHTDLATAKNGVENEELKKIVTDNYVWIGLHRVVWQWSDGSTFSSIVTLSKTSTVSGSERLCVVLVRPPSAVHLNEWEALRCSAKRHFVCYSEAKRRYVQFQKIQFKSDINVNNAAVQEAILAQLKKKLQEHGLPAGTTLSWRKSNGQIFQEIKNEKKNQKKKRKRRSKDEF